VHDITELENRGIPSVFIASDEFMGAAAAQSEALGFKPAAVYVPHPIQDRTDGEMMNLADVAYAEIIRSISRQG
jgi:hypothetical protein